VLDEPQHEDRWPAGIAILIDRVWPASADLGGFGLEAYTVLETVRLLGFGREEFVVTVCPSEVGFDDDDAPEVRGAMEGESGWWSGLGFRPSRPDSRIWLAFGSDLRGVERAGVLGGRFADYDTEL
jgi:hypothetical protein